LGKEQSRCPTYPDNVSGDELGVVFAVTQEESHSLCSGLKILGCQEVGKLTELVSFSHSPK